MAGTRVPLITGLPNRTFSSADYLLRVVARDIPQYREILMERYGGPVPEERQVGVLPKSSRRRSFLLRSTTAGSATGTICSMTLLID